VKEAEMSGGPKPADEAKPAEKPADKKVDPRQSTAIDVHVGRRLEERRLDLRWSRPQMAAACELSISQLIKYETGKNRLSASRLFQISVLLGVPVAWFFEDAPVSAEDQGVTSLVASYKEISDPSSRDQVIRIAQHLARLDTKSKT
jgi:transcriptional regulator with XRE-family HTH domain